MECSVWDAGISIVKYRVGAPPLQLLPLEDGESDACTRVHNVLGNSLQDQASIIASLEGVELLGAVLVSRFIPGSSANRGRTTLLMAAEWEDQTSPTAWEKIVKDTKKYVDRAIRQEDQLQDVEVGVEMIAPEVVREFGFLPAQPDELPTGMFTRWHLMMKGGVKAILDRHDATRGKVKAVILCTHKNCPDDNRSPGVLIRVGYESKESQWPDITGEIERLIRMYSWDELCVHIQHYESETEIFDREMEEATDLIAGL